jgi:hypothetical protein
MTKNRESGADKLQKITSLNKGEIPAITLVKAMEKITSFFLED